MTNRNEDVAPSGNSANEASMGLSPIAEDGQTAEQQTAGQGSGVGEKQGARELHKLERWYFISQTVLAIIGVVAVCIYGGQLKQMLRANDLTRQSGLDQVNAQQEQMKLDEAAQVLIESATISDLPSGHPTVSLLFKNTGRTPNKPGEIKVADALIEPPGRAENEIAAVERGFQRLPSDAAIVPLTKLYSQQTRNTPMRFEDSLLSPKNIRLILSGQNRLMVYGIYSYPDMFDKIHHDRFCVNYYAPVNTDVGHDFVRTYLGNVAKRIPSDDEDSKFIKKALSDTVRTIPPSPVAMNFCVSGND